jgi:hypothetical protein
MEEFVVITTGNPHDLVVGVGRVSIVRSVVESSPTLGRSNPSANQQCYASKATLGLRPV